MHTAIGCRCLLDALLKRPSRNFLSLGCDRELLLFASSSPITSTMTEIQQISQLIQELDSQVQQAAVLSYNTMSATVVLLFEIIITFPDELRCIWLSRWSPITILHLLIRYFALGFLIVCSYVSINTNLSTKFCGPFDTFQPWGAVALVPTVDILIVIRVFALYDRSRWVGAVLAFCWLAETAIIFTLTTLGFGPNKGDAMPNPLPGIVSQCNPIDPFNVENLVIGGSVAMGLQAIYFGLAMLKLVQQFKSFRVLTPLLETFYRDGALYCFNILAMYGVSVFFAQHYALGSYQGLGEPWLVAIVTATAGRLVLNLRNSIHTTTSTSGILTESYELQFAAARGSTSRQMVSAILLDTPQLSTSNNNDGVNMSMEIEPLPSVHDAMVV